MFGIRRSPFGRGEDAADFMIRILDEEAAREGKPLSLEEKRLLRGEIGPNDVPNEFHRRMQRLVGAVLKREQETGQVQLSRSFSCAIEWAGDMEYPYVVWLAENAFGEVRPPVLRGWAAAKDALLCVGCALLLIGLVTFLVVGTLGLLGVK